MRRIGQIGIADIFFCEHRVIDIPTERSFNRADVWRVSVRRDLWAIHDPGAQIARERMGVCGRAFADQIAQHGLLCGRERDEKPHVAKLSGIASMHALLFFLDEVPLFIKLDLVYLQIAHHAVVQAFAAIADAKAEAHHGVAVYGSEALSRADRAPFGERANYLDLFVQWQSVHCRPRVLLSRANEATIETPASIVSGHSDTLE